MPSFLLTGSTANRGKDLKQAAQMAIDEVNAERGVNGHRLELALCDDGDQPAKARELAQQIAETNAVAVLGQVASSAGVAAGEVYKQRHIPAITGAASEARVTRNDDWFFRLFRSALGQGTFLADYVGYRYDAHAIGVVREKGTAGEELGAEAMGSKPAEECRRSIRQSRHRPDEFGAGGGIV